MTIGRFLLYLATHPDVLQKYEGTDDKRAFLKRFGLSEHQIELLASGELRHLKLEIEAELEVDNETMSIGTVYWAKAPMMTVHAPPPPPPPDEGSPADDAAE